MIAPAAARRPRADERARPVFDVVVPTIGRASLGRLLERLSTQDGDLPGRVIVVDDRSRPATPLPGVDGPLASRIDVVAGPARGPAAARNVGWRAAGAEWVAFLDDDVDAPPRWAAALAEDLRALPADVAASQGRVRVPRPAGRRATDWERNVAALETARWTTADMAYRRSVLAALGGFDERFPRAYREDAELGLRVVDAGHRIVLGSREILHPVRRADRWVSVRLQAGNADDPLMARLHGRAWRRAAGVPRGRRPWHVAIVVLGTAALAAAAARRRRLALVTGSAWLAGTSELALSRIAPGPRTASEVATMLATSVVLPWAATYHWARGVVRATTMPRASAVPRGGVPRVGV